MAKGLLKKIMALGIAGYITASAAKALAHDYKIKADSLETLSKVEDVMKENNINFAPNFCKWDVKYAGKKPKGIDGFYEIGLPINNSEKNPTQIKKILEDNGINCESKARNGWYDIFTGVENIDDDYKGIKKEITRVIKKIFKDGLIEFADRSTDEINHFGGKSKRDKFYTGFIRQIKVKKIKVYANSHNNKYLVTGKMKHTGKWSEVIPICIFEKIDDEWKITGAF